MKQIGRNHYSKIDILGVGSIMVKSSIDMNDSDVLESCVKKSIIDDDDIDFASVDNFIDEYDLSAFETSKCIHCLD